MKYWLRRFFREERSKLAVLSTREKIRYIWQYFGLFIVLGIGLIALIIFAISRLIIGEPQYWLYGAFANTMAEPGKISAITRDFAADMEYDVTEKQVEFSTNMYFDYTRNQAIGNEYYNSFIALVEAETLDFITMFPEQLGPLGQSGRLMDWNMDECAELLEKYSDRLIYYEPPEDSEMTGPIPVGIDISDSLLVTQYGIYSDSCALGIAVTTQRLDAVSAFLDFILQ